MIKTYQEDLTLAAPLYSETDELWPLYPSDPNWCYAGSGSFEPFEWVSGKGVGACDPSAILLLRKMHSSCAIIDCTASILFDGTVGEFDFTFAATIKFNAAGVSCEVRISNAEYPSGSILAVLRNKGIPAVALDPVEISSGVLEIRFYDDGTHYRLSKNGTTLASIEKTPDNIAKFSLREDAHPAFSFQAFNAEDKPKFYMKSVDFEYDEFVSNPFWTDLINCHETT